MLQATDSKTIVYHGTTSVVPPLRPWKAALTAAALGLLLTLPSFSESKANIPDWVRQAAAQPLPTYDSETNAVALLTDETDTVTSPDEHIEHYRRVVKILRPDGRDEGDLAVWIGHEGKLISIHAWSIDAAGHEYEVKDKDFADRASAFQEEYSDIRQKWAKAPAADPGSIIAFEYEVRRRDYFNELRWFPQEDIPVRRAVFTVQLPSGWELKDWWSGLEPVKPASAGPAGWQWIKTDLAGVEDEPRRPSIEALAGRLTIQLYTQTRPLGTDWAAVSKWAAGLFHASASPSPEMSAKVQELTAGKTDFDSRVRAITEFVQHEFRYYAIEIGIGGYQPHPASDVFHLRYGDCKDKANTLSVLLTIAGVKSDVVLIDTSRGVVRADLPSTMFNHAILAIELPADIPSDKYPATVTTKSGKRYVIFDPTDEWMPFGQVRSELQDSYALLVTESGGELIKVPTLNPNDSELLRSAKLTLSPDGTISGSFQEKMTGDFAQELRMGAESANQQQRLQRYERIVSHSLKNASVQDLSFDGLKELNRPVDVRYSVSADRYAQIMGPLLIVRPRVLGIKSIALQKPRKPRKYPFVLGRTAYETDSYEVDLPAGYAVDDKPDPISIDTPFASYKSKIEITGNKLHYSREYVLKSLEIPADKIDDLRAFENKVAEDENAAVVLKKVPDASGR